MERDQLWKLLDSIQGHIRAFDSKAQVALGLDSLLTGLLTAEIAKAAEFSAWHFGWWIGILGVLAATSVACLLVSVIYSIRTVLPRLHLNQPKSHIFFCHLVDLYSQDFGSAVQGLTGLTDHQFAHELASQVQANAIICDAKARRSRRALCYMSISLALYLTSVIPLAALAYHHNAASNPAAKVPVTAVQPDHRSAEPSK